MRYLACISILLFVFTVQADIVQLDVNQYHETKNQLILDDDRFDEYRDIAESLGLDYDREYDYQAYSDIAHMNEIGSAGHYDFLLFSTGGDSKDAEAMMRSMNAAISWEAIYYDNHDVTVIMQKSNEGDHSFIKLLKIARGKVPDLHLK